MYCSKSCLLFALVCALLSAPVFAAPIPPTPTGKIARIVIFGSKNVPESDIWAALTEKTGDAYSPEAAEKDRVAVQALGFFQGTVAESAAPDPAGGVDLTFTVAEYPIVTAIKFVADTPTKEPTIPSATLVSQMTVKIGQVLDLNVLYRDFTTLFDPFRGYVTNQGYYFSVGTGMDIDPKTGVVTIPLIEYHVQAVKVTGLSPAKTADVLTKIHVKPGDLYDSGLLRADFAAIYTAGFLPVGQPSFNVTAPGLVTLSISLTERRTDSVVTLDESQGRVIPFQYDPVTCPFPVIQISINGKPPLPFIVDTGTNVALTLAPWAVAALGLEPTESTPAPDATAYNLGFSLRANTPKDAPPQKQEGAAYTSVALQSAVLQGKSAADTVTFNITQAYVLDMSFIPDAFQGLHIAGIVGLGMLGPTTTRFDFAAKTMTVYYYAHPPLHIPGAETLPLTANSNGLAMIQVALAPGVSDTLVFDTGSELTQIHHAAAQKLHPSAVGYTFTGRIEGWYENPALRLPEITLGALRVPNVLLETTGDSTSASLGLDILAGYRLTLDGPHLELTLEPSAAGGRYTQGWSGVELTQDARENLSVKNLRAGSPALKAGLRVGDAIETISGLTAAGLPDTQVYALIGGLTGRAVSVRRRRNGQMQTLTWIPLDDVTVPPSALYGLTMRRPNGGPWEVLDVLPGSPAAKAGLRAGDKITSLGGHSVATTSLDQETHLISQSSLPLIVTRKGRKAPLAVTLTAPPPQPLKK